MRGKGRCFYGSSNGHHDAVRISPTSSVTVQVRYDNGQWYDEWSSGGPSIVELVWQDNDWVDAVLDNGRTVHTVLLRR